MSRKSRIRFLGILAVVILAVALVSRKEQPDDNSHSNGTFLLLRQRASDEPRTTAPLLSIPMQTTESDAPPTPTLRIPVIQATPQRANRNSLRPYPSADRLD